MILAFSVKIQINKILNIIQLEIKKQEEIIKIYSLMYIINI